MRVVAACPGEGTVGGAFGDGPLHCPAVTPEAKSDGSSSAVVSIFCHFWLNKLVSSCSSVSSLGDKGGGLSPSKVSAGPGPDITLTPEKGCLGRSAASGEEPPLILSLRAKCGEGLSPSCWNPCLFAWASSWRRALWANSLAGPTLPFALVLGSYGEPIFIRILVPGFSWVQALFGPHIFGSGLTGCFAAPDTATDCDNVAQDCSPGLAPARLERCFGLKQAPPLEGSLTDSDCAAHLVGLLEPVPTLLADLLPALPDDATPMRVHSDPSTRKSPRLARQSGKGALDLAMDRKVALRGAGSTVRGPALGTRGRELGDSSAKGKIKRKCAKLGIKMGDTDASLFLDFVTADN